MTDLIRLDPLLYGYFLDETLEHGERVGLALLHGAKYTEISLSRQLLPDTAFQTNYDTSSEKFQNYYELHLI